jgi:tetratricopeptide (TPR) repeat protein
VGIKGDVKSISLANVLQDLAMNEQTGTLRIRQKERELFLWFERGALRLVGVGPGEGPSVLNGLLALGRIQTRDLPPAGGRTTSEARLVRSLLKSGRVKHEDLRLALEHQMAERLCDAFLWSDAGFEFEEGDPDDRSFDADQLDLEPRLAIDAAIVEAVRRADEWGEVRKAILSTDEILVADPKRAPADADATVQRILALMDGHRSLREIQDLTRLSQFAVHRAAALLVRGGAARPLLVAEALERARARAARKDWDAALRMIRYGLDHERSNTGLLELAMRVAEGKEDHDLAASFGRQLAASQVESGALEAAVETYQKVLGHAPRDVVAHERLFGLMLQLDLKLDALATGEALAAAYKKAGLPDQALGVYKRLVEKVGDHTELLESLAEIQRHLGDRQEAIGVYRKLLARSLEGRDDPAALDYCRTILRIDPRHEEARRFREQLESGRLERSRRRRRTVKMLVSLGLVVALVGAVGAYEWRARSSLGRARAAILEATAEKRYREAMRLYHEAVLDRYPLSLMAREVRPERDRIEELFVKEERARSADLDRRGRLAEAVRILEEASEIVRRSDLAGEVSWELVQLRGRLVAQEEEWSRRVAGLGVEELARVSDPLAVRALEGCLTGADASRRLSAVAALGSIPVDAAVNALILALGDLDPSVCRAAAAQLAGRTGQDFGTDRRKWEEWWLRTGAPSGRPLLQALLVAPRQTFGAGESLLVEWRVAHVGDGDIEFVLEGMPADRLQIIGPEGPAAFPVSPKASPRPLRLGPGEFVGGTFDLGALARAPGTYRLAWTAAVAWRGKSLLLEASSLSLERAR